MEFSEIFQNSYFNALSITPQNGHISFKNLAANSSRFLKCVWPFWGFMHKRVKNNSKQNSMATFDRSGPSLSKL